MKLIVEENHSRVTIEHDCMCILLGVEWSGEDPEKATVALGPEAASTLIRVLMMQLDSLTEELEKD